MQQLSPGENTLLGCCAGTIEISLLQPLLYCKNSIQQKLPLTINPRYLYRGVFASALNMATATGIQFFGTGLIQRTVVGQEAATRTLTDNEIILSALGGGMISGLFCGPIEFVMIQQQRFGGSFGGTQYRVIRSHGPIAFTRGVIPTIGREGIYTAGYLGMVPVLTKLAQQSGYFDNVNVNILQLGSGIFSAFIASVTTHPMDTIKTCMQGDLERKTYTNLSRTGISIYQQGGIRRFYNGFGWRYARMCLAMYILNKAKEVLAPVLFPHHFHNGEQKEGGQ